MNERRPGYDDQGLPWLEAVDDEDGPRGVSARKMLAALLLVLLAGAIVAGDLLLARPARCARSTGAPELIRAEPGPYKVKPTIPAGSTSPAKARPLFDQRGRGSRRRARRDASCREGVEAPAPEPVAGRRRPRKSPPKEAKEPAPADGRAAPRRRADDPAWRLCLDDQGRDRLEHAVGALPRGRGAEQVGGHRDRRRQVGLPAARGRLVRADPGGLRGAEGGGRKLPGRSTDAGGDLRAGRDANSAPTSAAFFRDARPAGYILFRRNIETASSCGG